MTIQTKMIRIHPRMTDNSRSRTGAEGREERKDLIGGTSGQGVASKVEEESGSESQSPR